MKCHVMLFGALLAVLSLEPVALASQSVFGLSWTRSQPAQFIDYRTCPGTSGKGIQQERLGYSTRGAASFDADFSFDEVTKGLAREIADDILGYLKPAREIDWNPTCPDVSFSRHENGSPDNGRLEPGLCRSRGDSAESLAFLTPSRAGEESPFEFGVSRVSLDPIGDTAQLEADLMQALGNRAGFKTPSTSPSGPLASLLTRLESTYTVLENAFALLPKPNLRISGSVFLLVSKANPSDAGAVVSYDVRYQRVVRCDAE